MSAPNVYDIGDVVRLRAVFTDADGNAADPATVVSEMKTPDGTITTYSYGVDAEVIRDSEGSYYVDFAPLLKGKHFYRLAGTGVVQAAAEGYFNVRASAFS